jgi:hypothetical protein
MLDLAQVKPGDFVMDLGSGDGRNIIGAARRGAWGLGVEFNPDLVELSQRNAAAAGLSDQARFIEGDMYEANIAGASVLALFLLPDNLNKLVPKFLDMPPGSRIVSNTFAIDGWMPDGASSEMNCSAWCTALLWIVPARVAGTWQTPDGPLTLTQEFQMITGTLGTTPVTGRLNGDQITFKAGAKEYSGKVAGDRIDGVGWTATRTR